METMMQEVQVKVARWFTSEVATQGKEVRIESKFLPGHDVKAVVTSSRDFDMAMLRSGDQDLVGWAREAVRALVAELPDVTIVTPPQLQIVRAADVVKAWLALHAMTPNADLTR